MILLPSLGRLYIISSKRYFLQVLGFKIKIFYQGGPCSLLKFLIKHLLKNFNKELTILKKLYIQIQMFLYITNCGYSLMVKFLLAKENMRVRFPLPAFDFYISYIYYYYGLTIINQLLIITKIKKVLQFIFYVYFSLYFCTLQIYLRQFIIICYCKFYTFSGDGI